MRLRMRLCTLVRSCGKIDPSRTALWERVKEIRGRKSSQLPDLRTQGSPRYRPGLNVCDHRARERRRERRWRPRPPSASESRPGFYLMKSAIENLIGLPGAACKVQSAGPLQFTCNARTMHTERNRLRVLELLLANPPPRSRACSPSRDERGRDKPMDKPWDNKRTAATYATV